MNNHSTEDGERQEVDTQKTVDRFIEDWTETLAVYTMNLLKYNFLNHFKVEFKEE